MSGTLALIGGPLFEGPFPAAGAPARDGVAAQEKATGPGLEPQRLFDPGSTVELLATAMAYEDPAGAVDAARQRLEAMDCELRVLEVMSRADAFEEDVATRVKEARAIHVTGGSPMHLRSVLKDTPLLDALVGAWSGGATVSVAAESCSVLCSHMVDNRGGAFTVGLGLVTTMTVIPRFDHWSADKRTRTISLAPAELVVVGIDERTTLVRAPDGSWSVTGDGSVHVFSEGHQIDLDGLPARLNPDAGF